MKRGILGALVVLLSAVSLAPSAPIMLALEPDPSPGLGVGDIVDVGLYGRSGPTPENVRSVQAFVTFDDAVLRVVDASGDPASTVIPGPSLGIVFANVVGPDTARELFDGEIWYSATAFPASAPTDFLVATVRFEVLTEFASTTIGLPPGIIKRDPFQYETKATPPGVRELQGATLIGTEEPTQDLPIPEPTSLFVFCVGTCALGMRRRRSRRRHIGR